MTDIASARNHASLDLRHRRGPKPAPGKRYRAEVRFRFYGIAAVVFAFAFLVLLSTTSSQGDACLHDSSLGLDVDVAPRRSIPRTPASPKCSSPPADFDGGDPRRLLEGASPTPPPIGTPAAADQTGLERRCRRCSAGMLADPRLIGKTVKASDPPVRRRGPLPARPHLPHRDHARPRRGERLRVQPAASPCSPRRTPSRTKLLFAKNGAACPSRPRPGASRNGPGSNIAAARHRARSAPNRTPRRRQGVRRSRAAPARRGRSPQGDRELCFYERQVAEGTQKAVESSANPLPTRSAGPRTLDTDAAVRCSSAINGGVIQGRPPSAARATVM